MSWGSSASGVVSSKGASRCATPTTPTVTSFLSMVRWYFVMAVWLTVMVRRSTLAAKTVPLLSRMRPRTAGTTDVASRLVNAAFWLSAASNACTRTSWAANTVRMNNDAM